MQHLRKYWDGSTDLASNALQSSNLMAAQEDVGYNNNNVDTDIGNIEDNDEPPYWEQPQEFVKFPLRIRVSTGPLRDMREEDIRFWCQVKGTLGLTEEEVFPSAIAPATICFAEIFTDDHVGTVQEIVLGHTCSNGTGIWLHEISVEDPTAQSLFTFTANCWLQSDMPEVAPVAVLGFPVVEKIKSVERKEKLVIIKLRCGTEDELIQGLNRFSQWCAAKGTRCLHISINNSKTKADLHVAVPKEQVDYRKVCLNLGREVQRMIATYKSRNEWIATVGAHHQLTLTLLTQKARDLLRRQKESVWFLADYMQQTAARNAYIAKKQSAELMSAWVMRKFRLSAVDRFSYATQRLESALIRRSRRHRLWKQRTAAVLLQASYRRMSLQKLYYAWNIQTNPRVASTTPTHTEADGLDINALMNTNFGDEIKSAGLTAIRSKIGKVSKGAMMTMLLSHSKPAVEAAMPTEANTATFMFTPAPPTEPRTKAKTILERYKDVRGAWKRVGGPKPKTPPGELSPYSRSEELKRIRADEASMVKTYSTYQALKEPEFRLPPIPISLQNSPRNGRLTARAGSKRPIDDLIYWLQNDTDGNISARRSAQQLMKMRSKHRMGQILGIDSKSPSSSYPTDLDAHAILQGVNRVEYGQSDGNFMQLLQNILSEDLNEDLADQHCELQFMLPAIRR